MEEWVQTLSRELDFSLYECLNCLRSKIKLRLRLTSLEVERQFETCKLEIQNRLVCILYLVLVVIGKISEKKICNARMRPIDSQTRKW